jgi:hypothetical protein
MESVVLSAYKPRMILNGVAMFTLHNNSSNSPVYVHPTSTAAFCISFCFFCYLCPYASKMIRVCGLNIATENKKIRDPNFNNFHHSMVRLTNFTCIVDAICLGGRFAPKKEIQDSKGTVSEQYIVHSYITEIFHKLQLNCLMLAFGNFVSSQSKGFAKLKWS